MKRSLEAVGRGKGNATNVPERALIEQVRIRPLLYDKNVKDYRKPGASESAWSEVSAALATSVTNCKKRWKSLRDTFIKYYRLDVMYSAGEIRRKHKPWNFYTDLLFLKSHVELFRLEESIKSGNDSTFYSKETPGDASDNDRIILVEENKEIYEIKLREDEYEDETHNYKEEDHLLQAFEEEQIEDTIEEDYMMAEQEEILNEKSNEKLQNDHFEVYDMENEEEPEQSEEVQSSNQLQLHNEIQHQPQESLSLVEVAAPAKNVVDPDERYLMSCLPAFKRFTPQQKAYVRMGIERLFYEVEFENVSEPRNNKRSRMS